VTTKKVIFVAPGITKPIVDALAERLDSQRDLQCTLIFDLDPAVYRGGYGTEDGLSARQALIARHHLELRQQEGIRIGLLITDGQTVLYSPTPLLIEAGSISVNKPNCSHPGPGRFHRCHDAGMRLERRREGQHADSAASRNRSETGQKPATPVEVSASLKALKDMSPKIFDVARSERIFESKIQFVELEVTGYRLSTKKVSIPNDLLLGEDSTLKEKLKNGFALLQGNQMLQVSIPEFDADLSEATDAYAKPRTLIWSEAEREKQRKALYEAFLINVPQFGQVIMRNRQKDFDTWVARLKKQIAAFKNAVEEELSESVADAIADLAKTLLQRIRENLPARYAQFLTANDRSDDDLLAMSANDLGRSFGGTGELFNPELRCVFRDVTHESIQDAKFKQSLSEAMHRAGGEGIVQQLFCRHDAAPEAAARPTG
jgi:hypothetical protein